MLDYLVPVQAGALMLLVHGAEASAAGHPLNVISSRVTLDEAWSPYVQAELVCHLPGSAVVEAIDPRTSPRVVITLTRDLGGQSRTFDLVLVARTVDHRASTLTVTAASDEQLLIDAARVAATVDTSARAYKTSLRAILNSVVLPTIGASLRAAVVELRRNVALNPRAMSTAYWVTNGTLTRSLSGGRWWITAQAGKYTYAQGLGQVGQYYAASISVRGVPGSAATVLSTDNVVGPWLESVTVTIPASGEVRLTLRSGSAPAAGTTILFGLINPSADMFITQALIEKVAGPGLHAAGEYFDGDSPLTDGKVGAWTGGSSASPSVLNEVNATPDWSIAAAQEQALDWSPGEPAWDFAAPLVQASGLRLYCDENRHWRLVDPSAVVPGQVNITSGVNVTDALDTISRSRDWFNAVVIEYRWTNATGQPQTAWDAAGDTSSKVLKLTLDRPFPGNGAAQAILNRAKRRGRVLDLRALADYNVTPGKALLATLPDTPIQSGYVAAVTWTQPDSEMTVTSRGLTDTPSTAWTFLAAGVKWTDSPVGQSWIGES